MPHASRYIPELGHLSPTTVEGMMQKQAWVRKDKRGTVGKKRVQCLVETGTTRKEGSLGRGTRLNTKWLVRTHLLPI